MTTMRQLETLRRRSVARAIGRLAAIAPKLLFGLAAAPALSLRLAAVRAPAPIRCSRRSGGRP